MTFDELLAKYKNLFAENKQLKAEIAELRAKLGLSLPTEVAEIMNNATITKYSSSEDKIKIFMSLFIGRSDVYAKRWYSVKSEKSGYHPVCSNNWSELCNKSQYKCSACPNRKLLPLDNVDG